LKIIYPNAKSWINIGQNTTVIKINFLAMPHYEQKYIQSFVGESGREKHLEGLSADRRIPN